MPVAWGRDSGLGIATCRTPRSSVGVGKKADIQARIAQIAQRHIASLPRSLYPALLHF